MIKLWKFYVGLFEDFDWKFEEYCATAKDCEYKFWIASGGSFFEINEHPELSLPWPVRNFAFRKFKAVCRKKVTG